MSIEDMECYAKECSRIYRQMTGLIADMETARTTIGSVMEDEIAMLFSVKYDELKPCLGEVSFLLNDIGYKLAMYAKKLKELNIGNRNIKPDW